jgi:hypothetical protein
MNRYFVLICTAFASSVLAGCSKGGSSATAEPSKSKANSSYLSEVKVDSQTEGNIVPFAVGNEWTYTYESTVTDNKTSETRKTDAEVIYKIVKLDTPANGVKVATMEVYVDSTLREVQEWRSGSDGIFLLANRAPNGARTALTPAMPFISFPIKLERKFSWKGTGLGPAGAPAAMNYEFMFGSPQRVDTELGPMHALFIEMAGQFEETSSKKKGVSMLNSWYRPDVGLVRLRQVVEMGQVQAQNSLALKRFTIKK